MEQVRPDTSFHRGGGSAPRSHRSCKRCSDLSSQTQINKSRRYAVRGYGIRSSSFAGRIPMGISKNCFAWAGVAAMITSLHVFAADTSAPSSELETITVTAQKRSETEQTVPLSMTTFSAAALQQKEINTFFDYATKVPNLAFAPTGDGVGTARTVSIRGISGDGVTGFYIDDTPLPDSLDPRVLDIDHIEVLRGPQGTLYGARSMGGTVRIITKTPDFNQFSATVHGGASSTDRTDRANWDTDAVVNIPVMADHVAVRLSGFYDSEAGYFKRRYCTDPATAGVSCFPQTAAPALTATVKNVGAIQNYGGALAVTVKPLEALTITPRMMLQRSDYNGFWMSDVLTTGDNIGYPYPAGPSQLPRLKPSNFTQGRFFNIPESGFDSWHLYSVGVKWTTGFGDLVSSTAYFDRNVIESEDETDFIWTALLPAVTATPGFNLPGPIPSGITAEKNYQRFVQEVRFASQLSGPLQYVAGVFYSDLHGALPFASNYLSALAPGYGAALTAAGTCNVVGLCP